MKENFDAYFRLSSKEIEIAGPVDYVKEQLSAHSIVISRFVEDLKRPFLQKELPGPDKTMDIFSARTTRTSDVEDNAYSEFEDVIPGDDVFKKYEHIVAKTGNKFQILVQIPGDKQTQRMVNVVLIYLYLKVKSGVEVLTFDELRQACESHAELDKGHFSEYIKNNRKFFVIEGAGKSMNARLTMPGMREAERILNNLNEKK